MTVNTKANNTFCIVKTRKYFILLAFILPPTSIYAAEVKQQQKNLFMSMETGIAYDSNIYRSPDKTYLDYAKKCIIGTDPNCFNGNDIVPHIDPNQGHTQVNPTTY
ncbi:MAG: hypothetical protein ACC657_13800, partial [Thiohalomonadales bacterium]